MNEWVSLVGAGGGRYLVCFSLFSSAQDIVSSQKGLCVQSQLPLWSAWRSPHWLSDCLLQASEEACLDWTQALVLLLWPLGLCDSWLDAEQGKGHTAAKARWLFLNLIPSCCQPGLKYHPSLTMIDIFELGSLALEKCRRELNANHPSSPREVPFWLEMATAWKMVSQLKLVLSRHEALVSPDAWLRWPRTQSPSVSPILIPAWLGNQKFLRTFGSGSPVKK